ncbi:MAG: hypothetical protein OEV44_12670 [Spirochaetota bacterium]|nr:hypothetical protein [Spirochaetota bacterium]
MSEKKVTPFQFKKITREEMKKSSKKDIPGNLTNNKIEISTPKNDKQLLESVGEKDNLSMEDKIRIIDYVFKKDNSPIYICHSCGNKVGSKYFVSRSRKQEIIFCSGCYQSLPTCNNCGMPSKLMGPKLPTTYCQFCRINKVCDSCNIQITAKESYRIPFVKGTYCQKCFNENERCIICNIPILENNFSYKSDKPICSLCTDRNITEEEAIKLNNGVVQFLNKHFQISNSIKSNVKLINYLTLNTTGHPETLGKSINISGKTVITLYQYITKERAIGIFAYEYGKIILKHLNPRIVDINVIEDFALWSKSFVLQEYGEIDEASVIKSKINSNPILKSLFNIERLGGVSRILEKIKLGELGRK